MLVFFSRASSVFVCVCVCFCICVLVDLPAFIWLRVWLFACMSFRLFSSLVGGCSLNLLVGFDVFGWLCACVCLVFGSWMRV